MPCLVESFSNTTSDKRRRWIDSSGFDRSHASEYYTKRTELTIQQLKVTLLVNAKVNAILNLHLTTTRRHDSQIAPSLIKRNSEHVEILLGNKGYDEKIT